MTRQVTLAVVVPLVPPLFDKTLVTLRLNQVDGSHPGYFQFPTFEVAPNKDSEAAAKVALRQFLGVKMDSSRILYFGQAQAEPMFLDGPTTKIDQYAYLLKPTDRADIDSPPTGFSPWYEWPLDWCTMREGLFMPMQSHAAELAAAYRSKINNRVQLLQKMSSDNKLRHVTKLRRITVGLAALQFLKEQPEYGHVHANGNGNGAATKKPRSVMGQWNGVPVLKHVKIPPSAIIATIAGDSEDSDVTL